MNKAFRVVYSALFFIALAAPLCLMPFIKPDTDIEKRELAKAPSLIEDGSINTQFSEQAEAWYNDRLPLRSKLLEGASFIKGEVFGAPSGNVIPGKDGWLFYESTVADYMDTNALSERQISSIAVSIGLIEEKAKAMGGRFLFVPMPNKSAVYPEYMPVWYTHADENNYTRLADKLKIMGVSFLDMKEVLTSNKDMGLYHKRDTHWNYLGALVGYNAMMDALGKEHKTYDSASYTITNDWVGDLEKLLYPSDPGYDEQYRFDIEYDDFRFLMPPTAKDTKKSLEVFMSDLEQNDIRIKTQKTAKTGQGDLYMIRDSFGRALLPFMIDNYDTAMFERRTTPNMSLMPQGGDLIFEIVERNLGSLLYSVPVMAAPLREVTDFTGDYAADGNAAFSADEQNGVRVFGTVDDNFLSDDTRVYVRLDGEKSFTFEAFPLVDKDSLKSEGVEDAENGFSALIEKGSVPDGEYSVSIISNKMKSVELTKIKIEGANE